MSRRQVSAPATFAPDIFEFVYFARPDSQMYGRGIHAARRQMGETLAAEHPALADSIDLGDLGGGKVPAQDVDHVAEEKVGGG